MWLPVRHCGLLDHYDGHAVWVSTLVVHARRMRHARWEGQGALGQVFGCFDNLTFRVQVDADIEWFLIDAATGMERVEHQLDGRYVGRLVAQLLRNTSWEPFLPWNGGHISLLTCCSPDVLRVDWHPCLFVVHDHLWQEFCWLFVRDCGRVLLPLLHSVEIQPGLVGIRGGIQLLTLCKQFDLIEVLRHRRQNGIRLLLSLFARDECLCCHASHV